MTKLVVGKEYKPIHRDFITKKIVKSRKLWKYEGKQIGGTFDIDYLLFYTDKTIKLIPEFLFIGVV